MSETNIISITGRTDDKQVLLVNKIKSEAIIMGISDIDNAIFVVITYLKATELGTDILPGSNIEIINYAQYSVEQQSGYIIKYKWL